MKTLEGWLAEYGVSHRNSTNRRVHLVCVPAILWSLTGLLSFLRFSSGGILRSAAGVAALLALGFYATLGLRPLIEMALLLALCFALCAATEFFTPYAGAIYGCVF
ncbi:MAG: Mpo1-like protein, partial [Bdellovibrionota bacterium]